MLWKIKFITATSTYSFLVLLHVSESKLYLTNLQLEWPFQYCQVSMKVLSCRFQERNIFLSLHRLLQYLLAPACIRIKNMVSWRDGQGGKEEKNGFRSLTPCGYPWESPVWPDWRTMLIFFSSSFLLFFFFSSFFLSFFFWWKGNNTFHSYGGKNNVDIYFY